MNKILLINPPFTCKEEYKFWISSLGTKANPPLGLAYIASMCLKKGYLVEIIDALAEGINLDELRQRIARIKPGIVGVSATTPMINNAFGVLKLVKECSSSTLTVLGGSHITAEPSLTMNECRELDVGVLGEGEETFLELSGAYLSSDKEFSQIKGIVYREDGKVVINAQRPHIPDINSIPPPAYHLLPIQLYSPSPLNYRRLPAMSMISSRGCPFQCLFCTKGVFGDRVRKLSPERIYEQAKYLVDKYKVKEIHFYDDTFILDMDWVKAACGYLKRLNLSWWCNGRVNSINKEILTHLKKAGCYRIYFGVESANEKSLRLLKKTTTLEQIKDAFRITREAGIETGAFMMLGIPGENTQDMGRSIKLIKEIKADHAVFSVLTPYPGTEIYRNYEMYGTLRKASWKDFVMISNDPIFLPYTVTKDELNRYLMLAYKTVVFRPLFIKNKIRDIFYSPHKFFFYIKGLISSLKNIFK